MRRGGSYKAVRHRLKIVWTTHMVHSIVRTMVRRGTVVKVTTVPRSTGQWDGDGCNAGTVALAEKGELNCEKHAV